MQKGKLSSYTNGEKFNRLKAELAAAEVEVYQAQSRLAKLKEQLKLEVEKLIGSQENPG